MIPQSFQQCFHCIVQECKIELTKEFAWQRLEVLQNLHHSETKKFVSLYATEHLQNVISWFKKIAST
jgi:hypothetical protein